VLFCFFFPHPLLFISFGCPFSPTPPREIFARHVARHPRFSLLVPTFSSFNKCRAISKPQPVRLVHLFSPVHKEPNCPLLLPLPFLVFLRFPPLAYRVYGTPPFVFVFPVPFIMTAKTMHSRSTTDPFPLSPISTLGPPNPPSRICRIGFNYSPSVIISPVAPPSPASSIPLLSFPFHLSSLVSVLFRLLSFKSLEY